VGDIKGSASESDESSRVTFNLDKHDVEVGEDRIVVRGKTSDSWGKEVVLDRSTATAETETESARPLYLVYATFAIYTFGFLLIFVQDGIAVSTQMVLFGIAALLILLPLSLYFALPLKLFAVAAVVFYVLTFSFSGLGQLETILSIVEDLVGEDYLEAFIMGAGMLPVLLHVMVSQTIVTRRLRIADQGRAVELTSAGRSAERLVEYLERGSLPGDWADAFRRLLEFRVPLFFLRLSRQRMKRCQYCGKDTLIECTRCHRPICSEHAELLRGYKVCVDCYKDRHGKLRRGGWNR
jgi:hypothetical protein